MKALLRPVIDRLHPARSIKRTHREPEQQQELDNSTDKLTLYYFPTCPYCIRVQKVIDKNALNIRLKNINRDREAREELEAGGGKAMVPCLRIDADNETTWLYESTDIIRFLDKLVTTV